MSAGIIELLDRVSEVDVETVSPKGTMHRVPIWVVVVDGAAYAMSAHGEKGRWYRELSARDGALVVEGRRIPVHAVPVADGTVRTRILEAYETKYKPSREILAAMQRPEVLTTTMRLDPIGVER